MPMLILRALKQNAQNQSWSLVETFCRPQCLFPLHLDTLVSFYCSLESQPQCSLDVPLECHQYAAGWNPTATDNFNDHYGEKFRNGLKLSDAIAVEKIGLDFLQDCNPDAQSVQQDLIKYKCQKAYQFSKLVIVSCVEADNCSSHANNFCWDIMAKGLPCNWPECLLSYNQRIATFCRLLQVFPEVRLNMSPLAVRLRMMFFTHKEKPC